MDFPEFGIKEILAALVEGKGEHLEADDYDQYPGVADGSILVNMPGFTVIMQPSPDDQCVIVTALDENGNEFCRVYHNRWFAI